MSKCVSEPSMLKHFSVTVCLCIPVGTLTLTSLQTFGKMLCSLDNCRTRCPSGIAGVLVLNIAELGLHLNLRLTSECSVGQAHKLFVFGADKGTSRTSSIFFCCSKGI